MTSQPENSTPGTDLVKVPEHIVARVRDLVAGIPQEQGDGSERLLTKLLDATSLDELNAPWQATSGRSLAGKRLKITSLMQRPSQYADGTGIFLVAEAVDTLTGEDATFTTSAWATVVQLANAWDRGMFPIIAEIVVAERPTQRGFYPYHLNILAAQAGQKVQDEPAF